MLIVLLGISLLYFKISSVKSKALIWSIAAVQLLVTNLLKTDHYLRLFQKWAGLNNADTMEVMIISAWCFLKCVSFSLEFINCSNEKQKFAIMNFLHYVFYFPTLFLGPVMVYGRFSHHTSRSTTTTTLWIKLKKLTLDIGRLFIWGIFLELSLHYLYVNSLQNSVKIVNKMETPTLFGFAYLTGQYFHLKYVVGYGIGISVANFDGHQPPRTPICIARVHRFSDMWKYFDEGLYEFLFKLVIFISMFVFPRLLRLFSFQIHLLRLLSQTRFQISENPRHVHHIPVCVPLARVLPVCVRLGDNELTLSATGNLVDKV